MTDNLLTNTIPAPEAESAPTIPDKFLDKATGEVRVDALLNSYLALEKRMARMVPLPENDADTMRIFKLLGRPDSADEYQITLPNEAISIDPELNSRLHAKGFTNAQVQEIYDLATEKLVPLILEMAAEFQSDRETLRLQDHFGGADAWAEMARQLKDFGQKNLPPSAYEGLACSYEGVLALHKMMQGGGKQFGTSSNTLSSASLNEDSLRKMMQSPKYWRERDPGFMAEVAAGFEKLYGQNS